MQASERTILAVGVKNGQGTEINNFLGFEFHFGFVTAFDIAYIGCLSILEEHLHISVGVRACW